MFESRKIFVHVIIIFQTHERTRPEFREAEINSIGIEAQLQGQFEIHPKYQQYFFANRQ